MNLKASLALLVFSACNLGPVDGREPVVAADAGVIESSLPRVTSNAPVTDFEKGAAGQRTFALDLYRTVAASAGDKPVFISPYSVNVALSMTYAGARGTTATAFETVLKSGLAADVHHRVTNQIDRMLTAKVESKEPFSLSTANRVFAQDGLPVHQAFLDTLAMEYGAGVGIEDFARQPEPAREHINQWVASKTEDRIKELLPEGSIGSNTPMVLVNAMTFTGTWATRFGKPYEGRFTQLNGTELAPQVVSLQNTLQASLINGVEAVRLPYADSTLSMEIFMPPAGQFKSFEASLSEQTLDELEDGFSSELVNLTMPKFEMREGLKLSQPLTQMGLGIAFGAADFSGISPMSMNISEVIHQAFIKVDENGTEAAAATAVILDGGTSHGGQPPTPRTVVLNRPFVIVIRDAATDTVVFIGRVVKP